MFLGRAYEHIFFNPHYREFFWNPKIMLGIVNSVFGMSWNQYMTSYEVDNNIQLFIKCIGFLFLGIAIICLFAHRLPKLKEAPILGLVLLLPTIWFHYYGYWSNIVLLFEFTAQVCLAVLLYLSLRDMPAHKLLNFARWAIAITFIAHGLYAMNIVPLPQKFIAMTIKATGWSNAFAREMLFIAGCLDLLVAIGLFIPRLMKPSLWYIIGWGFLTAFARIYSNFYSYDPINSLHQWAWQFLIRTPHYSLGILLLINSKLITQQFRSHFFSLPFSKKLKDEQYKMV